MDAFSLRCKRVAAHIHRFLFEHLNEIEASYVSHMKHALMAACGFIGVGILIIIHAFVPGLFSLNGSRFVMKMHTKFLSDPTRGALYAKAFREQCETLDLPTKSHGSKQQKANHAITSETDTTHLSSR